MRSKLFKGDDGVHRDVAAVSIEVMFSNRLLDMVESAKRGGDDITVESVVKGLADVYEKTISQTPSFVRPLKALDKDVVIKVRTRVF